MNREAARTMATFFSTPTSSLGCSRPWHVVSSVVTCGDELRSGRLACADTGASPQQAVS